LPRSIAAWPASPRLARKTLGKTSMVETQG
jgi:hypothetical protein